MRTPVTFAARAIAKSITPARLNTATTPRSGRPYFGIGFHLRGHTWFARRGCDLRVVIRGHFPRRLGSGYVMDCPCDHLVHGSLASVLWRELAGLQCPFNKDVVSLLV